MKKGLRILVWMSWVALMMTISPLLPRFAVAQDSSRWDVTPNVNDLDDFNVQPNSPALAKSLREVPAPEGMEHERHAMGEAAGRIV